MTTSVPGAPSSGIIEPTLTSRYAHAEGRTLIGYLPDATQFLTAGDDTLVQRYRTDDPELLAQKVYHHEGAVLALAISERHFATGSDDYKVVLHDARTFECLRTLVECQLPVVDLDFDASGEWIAIATEETLLRVVNVSNPREMKSIPNLPRCPKCIRFDPRGKWLTMALSDGSFRAYETDLSSESLKLISAITNVMSPQEPSSSIVLGMSWHPKGDFIAIPALTDIRLLARDSFRHIQTLKSHNKLVISVVVSPNGRFLASADEEQVLVWSLATSSLICRYRTEHPASTLAWHPTANQLRFIDRGGEMAQWDDVVPAELFHAPKASASSSSASTSAKANMAQKKASSSPDKHRDRGKRPEKRKRSMVDDQAGESRSKKGGDDDDDDDDADDLGGDAEDEMDAEGDAAAEDDFDDLDDFVEDDDGAGYVPEKKQPRAGGASSANGRGLSVADVLTVHDVQELFPEQDVVQPGATPMLKDNKQFLAFNMLGTIKSTEGTVGRSIDIDFHDMSVRRPIYFRDAYNFAVASLGERGAVFGSHRATTTVSADPNTPEDELNDPLLNETDTATTTKKSPAVLHYYSFDEWGGTSNWTIDFPLHEDIETVTCGLEWVAVGLESGQLHILSNGGVQRDVIGIQGTIVGLAALEDTLMVCYNMGSTFQERQQLQYMLLDVSTMDVQRQGMLAMTNGADLAWLGFSESGFPCVYDTKGVLWQLFSSRTALWRPIFDARNERKSKKERFWPIAVTDTQLTCVICKGEAYPTVTNPILSDVNLKMPLSQISTTTRQLEERWLRVKLMTDHVESTAALAENAEKSEMLLDMVSTQRKQLDRLTLKMIKDACSAQQTVKALDLSKHLYDDGSYEYAYRLAVTLHQPQLATRMMQMREAKAQEAAAAAEAAAEARAMHNTTYKTTSFMAEDTNGDPFAAPIHAIEE